MSLFKRRKNEEAAEGHVTEAPVRRTAAERKAARKAPAVEKGISGEIVAVIAAAVAMMMGAGAKVVGIRRATRSGEGKAAWRNAGVNENTRPF